MAKDPDELRDQIRRYRDLLAQNTDRKAREALEAIIRELEAQLGDRREPD